MPRVPNVRPTAIYLMIDVRPETLVTYPDGKPFYCGKTVESPFERLIQHRSAAKRGVNLPSAKRLREGLDHHRVDTLDNIPLGFDWCEWEKFWIATLRHFHPDCANVSHGGEGAAGAIRSPEQSARMSAGQTGRILSAETRAKIGAKSKGRKYSAEVRAKLSAMRKGKKLSPKHRASVAAAIVLRRGTTMSDEARAKMREKALNRTPEHLAKIGAASRNRSPETLAKISASLKAYAQRRRVNPIPQAPEQSHA
jgi:hypothetical protein